MYINGEKGVQSAGKPINAHTKSCLYACMSHRVPLNPLYMHPINTQCQACTCMHAAMHVYMHA